MDLPESDGACKAFRDHAANDACRGCVFTTAQAPERGPFFDTPDGPALNYPGCVALFDGDTTSTGCGARNERLIQCEDALCGHCDDDGFPSCISAVDRGACAPYMNAVECAKPFDAKCWTDGDYVSSVAKIVGAFCGP